MPLRSSARYVVEESLQWRDSQLRRLRLWESRRRDHRTTDKGTIGDNGMNNRITQHEHIKRAASTSQRMRVPANYILHSTVSSSLH